MSRCQYHLKQKQAKQGSMMRPQWQTASSPHFDGLSPRNLPMQSGRSHPIWQAGNTAIARLLKQQSQGRSLDPNVLMEMEQRFGNDFKGIRFHNDAAAQAAADALDATAFVRGEDLYLGADAPPLESAEGKRLIAHELAHVEQQRQAGTVNTNQVSQSGDRFEQAADSTAQRVMQGHSAADGMKTSGAPPGFQRQERPPQRQRGVNRDRVQVMLTEFLQRELAAQGGSSLRVTPRVRSAVERIFIGDLGHLIGIQVWLQSPPHPSDPAGFAAEVARRLPETVEPARVAHLSRRSTPRRPSRSERIGQLIERTAPGSPERQEEQEATRLARGEAEPTTPRVPSPLGRLPEQPSTVERLERDIEVERAIRGAPEPTEVGPVSVDILRLGRIISGLPRALRSPRRRSDQPQARTYPQVEQVIQQISPDALIPAEARGTPQADDFADARLVARDLARRLDIAQQGGQESIILRLRSNYNNARDRSAIISEIARIVRLIRDALPHQAVSVAYVDVYFGNRLATRVVLRGSE